MRNGRRIISLCTLTAGAALLTAVLAPSAPAGSASEPGANAAACGKQTRFKARKDLPGRAPFVVGDSMLLGAAEEVAALGFALDVRICRPMSEGLDVIRARRKTKKLPKVVAIGLGSNAPLQRSELDDALKIVGAKRTLVLVTQFEYTGRSGIGAKLMRQTAACHPDRTVLIDWVRYAKRHPGMTYEDNIHLTPEGQQAVARLFRKALPDRLAKRAIPEPRC
jgi:hypothetical protein